MLKHSQDLDLWSPKAMLWGTFSAPSRTAALSALLVSQERRSCAVSFHPRSLTILLEESEVCFLHVSSSLHLVNPWIPAPNNLHNLKARENDQYQYVVHSFFNYLLWKTSLLFLLQKDTSVKQNFKNVTRKEKWYLQNRSPQFFLDSTDLKLALQVAVKVSEWLLHVPMDQHSPAEQVAGALVHRMPFLLMTAWVSLPFLPPSPC